MTVTSGPEDGPTETGYDEPPAPDLVDDVAAGGLDAGVDGGLDAGVEGQLEGGVEGQLEGGLEGGVDGQHDGQIDGQIDVGVEGAVEDADVGGPPLKGEELEAAVEAILFVSEQPVTLARLASGLAVPEQAAQEALTSLGLRRERAGGVRLREVAGGWRLTTAPDLDVHVTRFVLEGQHGRLSPAAMETLAIVAYRQPISRARIAAIRGVTSDGVVRTLLARGLLSDAGTEVGTSAALLTTTELFLNKIGVRDLTELPDLAPLLPDIETLEIS